MGKQNKETKQESSRMFHIRANFAKPMLAEVFLKFLGIIKERNFIVFYTAIIEGGYSTGNHSFTMVGRRPFFSEKWVIESISEFNPNYKAVVITNFIELSKKIPINRINISANKRIELYFLCLRVKQGIIFFYKLFASFRIK